MVNATTGLPDELAQIVRSPLPAVISTVHPQGYPVTVSTWFLLEDERHLLLSIDAADARGDRLEHLRRDPRLCVTVLPADDWVNCVALQCHVVEFEDDHDLAVIDRMSQHYLGRAYPRRRPRVCARVLIDSWDAPRMA